MDITLTTSTAAIIGIFIEALKQAGVPSRFAPLVNVILSFGAAAALAYLFGHDTAWLLSNAVTIAGTAAVGYDAVKGIRG